MMKREREATCEPPLANYLLKYSSLFSNLISLSLQESAQVLPLLISLPKPPTSMGFYLFFISNITISLPPLIPETQQMLDWFNLGCPDKAGKLCDDVSLEK